MLAYPRGVEQAALAILLMAFAGAIAPASADWSADITHNASGQLQVSITGDVDGVRSVYASCDPGRNTVLALLVPATDPTLTTSGMTLSFAFADGKRWASNAGLYRYDNTLVAVGYGNGNDVPAIVQALGTAQGPVQIGLGVPGGQAQSWTADVHGSASAARKFLDNCFGTN
jgi:hypothetical protein